MPDSIVLKARVTGKSAAKACRKNGLIPGIVYGRSIDPVPVALDAKAWKKLMVGMGTRIHHVTVDSPHFEADVMVQDADYDAINGRPLHVDLHSISMNEKVRAEVPVVVVGEDKLVKKGLILQRQLRELSVECLPGLIPENAVVDVGNLGPGGSVTAGELPLPEGVRLLTAPTEVVVVAVTPKAVEEEEQPGEAAPAAEGEAPAPAETKEEKPQPPSDR